MDDGVAVQVADIRHDGLPSILVRDDANEAKHESCQLRATRLSQRIMGVSSQVFVSLETCSE